MIATLCTHNRTGPGGYDQERTMFSMVKSVWVAELSLSHIHTVCALIPKIHSLLSNEVTMVLNGGECTWTRICIVLILKIDQKKSCTWWCDQL